MRVIFESDLWLFQATEATFLTFDAQVLPATRPQMKIIQKLIAIIVIIESIFEIHKTTLSVERMRCEQQMSIVKKNIRLVMLSTTTLPLSLRCNAANESSKKPCLLYSGVHIAKRDSAT